MSIVAPPPTPVSDIVIAGSLPFEAIANDYDSHDGSGRGDQYRANASFLLFAIMAILTGSFLITCGKRGWRVTTGLSTGLACQFLIWAMVVNLETRTYSGIEIWAFTFIGFAGGTAIGAYIWIAGMVLAAIESGLSLAIGICLFGSSSALGHTRWILIGVLPTLSAIICTFFSRTFGLAVATSCTGSFLLALGIDLFAETVNGFSIGLRHLFDYQNAAVRGYYEPTTAIRVIIAFSWALAIIASIAQTYYWRHVPFIRKFDHLIAMRNDKGAENIDFEEQAWLHITDTRQQQTTDGSLDGHKKEWSSSTQGREQLGDSLPHLDRMASISARSSAPPSPLGMYPPDLPATRPSSIVSTNLAQGLRSRPPTFFEPPRGFELVYTSDRRSISSMSQRRRQSHDAHRQDQTLTHTEQIPIEMVRRSPSQDEPPARHPYAYAANHSRALSMGSSSGQKSYRKPAPALDTGVEDNVTESPDGIEPPSQEPEVVLSSPPARASLTTRHSIENGINQGFRSGRNYSFPAGSHRGDTPTDDGATTASTAMIGSKFVDRRRPSTAPDKRREHAQPVSRFSMNTSALEGASLHDDASGTRSRELSAEHVPVVIERPPLPHSPRSFPLTIGYASETGPDLPNVPQSVIADWPTGPLTATESINSADFVTANEGYTPSVASTIGGQSSTRRQF